MKNVVMAGLMVVGAVICHGYETHVCGLGYGGVGDVTVHVNVINPKYSLQEAIDIAIADLEARCQEVNFTTLKRRVEKMPRGDVDIGNQSDFRKAIRWAIEKYQIKGAERISSQCNAPTPRGMTQDAFVEEYVNYKIQAMTLAEQKKLKGKIDGMRGYTRNAKNEAIKIWRAANPKN